MTQTTTRDIAAAKIAAIMADAAPAFDEARAGKARHAATLAGNLARNASRMKYLAMAATCIADGNSPTGIERENCVAYLLCTLEFMGEVIEREADNFEHSVFEVVGGGA